jgi:hypothetical protein
LVEKGVADDVIVKHIQARGFVFNLTADDILELHDQGVSDVVVEAMLDTSLQEQSTTPRSQRRYVDYDEPDAYVSLSAGYFSPWYWYPVAWGFYYDPFPSCYSSYYYPFRFCSSWGWYGGCHYWYPNYWAGYRWCDPYWWNYTSTHPGGWVNAPRATPGTRWESGRGMPARGTRAGGAHSGQPTTVVRTGQPAAPEGEPVEHVRVGETRSGRSATVHHPSRGGSRYVSRFSEGRAYLRRGASQGSAVSEPPRRIATGGGVSDRGSRQQWASMPRIGGFRFSSPVQAPSSRGSFSGFRGGGRSGVHMPSGPRGR